MGFDRHDLERLARGLSRHSRTAAALLLSAATLFAQPAAAQTSAAQTAAAQTALAQTAAAASADATAGATMAALERHREAASMLALTADGKLLYQRDAIKLDGYGYCGQALTLADRGELRQSIRAASKALYLGLDGDDDELIVVAQRDLAIAYGYAGWLDKAEEFARAALARETRNPAQAHAPAHKVLGDVALRRGAAAEALDHYARSLDIASDRFKPLVRMSMANAHTAAGDGARALALLDEAGAAGRAAREPIEAFYKRSRANALLAAGRGDEALALLGEVAADTRGADSAYQRLWAHDGIARIRQQRGDDAQALASYLEATRIAETLRARFRSDEFKTGLFGDVQSVFDAALRLAAARDDHTTAWTISEASRARQLLDTVRNRATDSLAERASLAQVQTLLGPNDAVLQYHVQADQTLVWLIGRDRIAGARLPHGEAELRADIERFRASIVARSSSTKPLAQELYAKLLPASLGLAAERIDIVAHGPLHYLPFQALHDGQRWFIERAALAAWPSAAVGVQIAARRAQGPGSLLAFGNPSTDRNVPRLPGAEREVREISRLFARNEVYVDSDATKARFTGNARAAGVLHVAAHAELDDVDPMFSRILFAPGSDAGGLVEAREIYQLDLGSVGLVTLSACESGLGRIARGDEIMGFTRSFLSAGSRSVIASLWPVEDEATRALMTHLYREATQGAGVMDALRSAQLEVLGKPRFAHPFFWAPFGVIGDGNLRIGDGKLQIGDAS